MFFIGIFLSLIIGQLIVLQGTQSLCQSSIQKPKVCTHTVFLQQLLKIIVLVISMQTDSHHQKMSSLLSKLRREKKNISVLNT